MRDCEAHNLAAIELGDVAKQTALEMAALARWNSLLADSPRAARYAEAAKSALVFPEIIKVGLGVGGEGGNGILVNKDRSFISVQVVPFSSDGIREEVVFEHVFQPGRDCLSWNPPNLMEAQRSVMGNLEITQSPLWIIRQTHLDRPRRPDPEQVDAAIATCLDEVAKTPWPLIGNDTTNHGCPRYEATQPVPARPDDTRRTPHRAIRLLALGLVRLRLAKEVSDETGESCLNYPVGQWRHATLTHRRNA